MIDTLRHQRYRYAEICADLAATGSTALVHPGVGGTALDLMLFEREYRRGPAKATYHLLTTGPVGDLWINIHPSIGGITDGLVLDPEGYRNRYDEAVVAQRNQGFLSFLGKFVEALVEQPETAIDDVLSTGPAEMRAPESVSKARRWSKVLRVAVRDHPDLVAAVIGRSVAPMVAWCPEVYKDATILLVDRLQPNGWVRRVLELAWVAFVLADAGGLISVGGVAPKVSDAARPAREIDFGNGATENGAAMRALGPWFDDAAFLLFQLATAGEPKGIAVPHRWLSPLCEALAEPFAADEDGANRQAGIGSPVLSLSRCLCKNVTPDFSVTPEVF